MISKETLKLNTKRLKSTVEFRTSLFMGSLKITRLSVWILKLIQLIFLKDCFSGSYDLKCRENNTGDATDLTFYMKHCMSIGNICEMTGYQPYDGKYCWDGTETVPWYTNATRTLASEEYFK